MKRTLDFDKAMYDFTCPECGGDIDWQESTLAYMWQAKCCGKYYVMTPKKMLIEEYSDE